MTNFVRNTWCHVMNFVKKFLRLVWEQLVFAWKTLVVYGVLGAVTGQTWAITVEILASTLLDFTLPPDSHKIAQSIGYAVGVIYGFRVKYREMNRQGTQHPSSKKCNCIPRKCRCRRLRRKRNASAGRPRHRKRIRET